MLLFRSEEQVDLWCTRTGEKRGAILPVSQVWELSKLWYHNRLDLGYRGRSPEEVEQIFTRVGLVGAFWKFSESP